jgi:hypothetical protein
VYTVDPCPSAVWVVEGHPHGLGNHQLVWIGGQKLSRVKLPDGEEYAMRRRSKEGDVN